VRPSPTLVAGAVALAVVALLLAAVPRVADLATAAELRADADSGRPLSDAARARGLQVDAAVPADVRGWVQAAVERTRPEARRLIDVIDGQVTLRVHPSDGVAAGFVQPTAEGFVLSLDADGLRSFDDEIRDHVIVHELGHVVDLALVPAALNDELDRAVPRLGGCTGEVEDAGCAPAEERFADTFAKWALDDPVVLSGVMSVGYRVAPPANLALWGEPLARLDP
jgi:hypothetical protein